MKEKELEKLWKSIDLRIFWQKVLLKTVIDIEQYRIARAKSKGGFI